MEPPRFSRRQGPLARPESLLYEDVTPRLRQGVVEILEDHELGLVGYGDWQPSDLRSDYSSSSGVARRLIDLWCYVVGVPQDARLKVSLPKIGADCAWYLVYDLCEATFEFLFPERRAAFLMKLNRLLAEEGAGYAMTPAGRIERIAGPSTHQAVSRARVTLGRPELKGAAEQFERAVASFNRRPNPEIDNCIKDAVGALEGVAQILSGRPKDTLGKIANSLASDGRMHGALTNLFHGVYGYRSQAPGIKHSITDEPRATLGEAELMLQTCGALIDYLAAKLGTSR